MNEITIFVYRCQGVTAETLSAFRTKFILDWFTKNATRFPFRLYEYHQQLLKSGMFDAYNQWIFGTAGNLPAYENWTKTTRKSTISSIISKRTGYLNYRQGNIIKQ